MEADAGEQQREDAEEHQQHHQGALAADRFVDLLCLRLQVRDRHVAIDFGDRARGCPGDARPAIRRPHARRASRRGRCSGSRGGRSIALRLLRLQPVVLASRATPTTSIGARLRAPMTSCRPIGFAPSKNVRRGGFVDDRDRAAPGRDPAGPSPRPGEDRQAHRLEEPGSDAIHQHRCAACRPGHLEAACSRPSHSAASSRRASRRGRRAPTAAAASTWRYNCLRARRRVAVERRIHLEDDQSRGSNPSSTLARLWIVRRNSAAPTTSGTEIATWTMHERAPGAQARRRRAGAALAHQVGVIARRESERREHARTSSAATADTACRERDAVGRRGRRRRHSAPIRRASTTIAGPAHEREQHAEDAAGAGRSRGSRPSPGGPAVRDRRRATAGSRTPAGAPPPRTSTRLAMLTHAIRNTSAATPPSIISGCLERLAAASRGRALHRAG